MIGLQLQLIIWLHFYAIPQESVELIFVHNFVHENFRNAMKLLNEKPTIFRSKKS